MYNGAVIGIFNGNLKKIKEDLSLLRPTLFIGVPRVYNKFHAAIMKKVSGQNQIV